MSRPLTIEKVGFITPMQPPGGDPDDLASVLGSSYVAHLLFFSFFFFFTVNGWSVDEPLKWLSLIWALQTFIHKVILSGQKSFIFIMTFSHFSLSPDNFEAVRLSSLFLHRRGEKPGFSSSHLLFPSNSSWRRVAASSSSHQGNLLATQALSTSQLRRDVQQENFKQQLSCTTQQKPARRFHRTSNGTATSFFPFPRMVKQLSLMIILGKARLFIWFCVMFISLICGVVILWVQVIWKLILVMLFSLSLHASSNLL